MEELYFEKFGTYAPVASHEAIRIIIAYVASNDLIVEGRDVANAYLYGKIDYQVIIEQQKIQQEGKKLQAKYV